MIVKYKKYTIKFDPPPIPAWVGCDYDVVHEDYDGEDDSDTEYAFRIGSVEAAKEYIDKMESYQ